MAEPGLKLRVCLLLPVHCAHTKAKLSGRSPTFHAFSPQWHPEASSVTVSRKTLVQNTAPARVMDLRTWPHPGPSADSATQGTQAARSTSKSQQLRPLWREGHGFGGSPQTHGCLRNVSSSVSTGFCLPLTFPLCSAFSLPCSSQAGSAEELGPLAIGHLRSYEQWLLPLRVERRRVDAPGRFRGPAPSPALPPILFSFYAGDFDPMGPPVSSLVLTSWAGVGRDQL